MILSALRRLWQPLGVEATLALATGLTSMILLTHPLYFDKRPGVYGHMAAVPLLSEEWHWGLFAAASCLLAAIGFVLSCAASAREVAFGLRAFGLGVGFAFWATFAGALLLGGDFSIGSVLSGAMALLSLRGLCAGPGSLRHE